VPPADGEDGTTSGPTTTASTTTSPSTTTTTSASTSSSTSTSTAETDTGETSGSDASEGGTTDFCSCEGMPIGLDDEVDEGFTPSEVIDGAPFADVQWIWYGLEAQPETTSTSGVEYKGGAVFDEVGGCCGSFLCAPCPEGVTIHEVMIAFSTADGRVAHAFTGNLTGPGFDGIEFQSEPVPLASLGGWLAREPFFSEGVPYETESVTLLAVWSFEDEQMVLDRAELYGDDFVRIGYFEL
jgi:hypothetical protein